MTTALQPTTAAPLAAPIDERTLEALVVGGDLSKLSPAQRLVVYRARCEAAGLDERTQPFQYLSLQGKLTLYATKSATDQLVSNRRLTVSVTDRRHIEALAIYEVTARVTFPDGHTVEDMAAVNVKGLQGEALCNAIMKCVTKAKRRTVLSACGLGLNDESEVETIPGAQLVGRESVEAPFQAAPAEVAPTTWKGPTQQQTKRLFGIAKLFGVTTKEDLYGVMADYGMPEHLRDLTRAQYDALCDDILPAIGRAAEALDAEPKPEHPAVSAMATALEGEFSDFPIPPDDDEMAV